MLIAEATEADLPEILAIYNEVIARTTAVYSNDPVTLENRFEWWSGRVAHGYPVLVARDPTGVMGFATFGDFRPWPGSGTPSNTRCTCARIAGGRGLGASWCGRCSPAPRHSASTS